MSKNLFQDVEYGQIGASAEFAENVVRQGFIRKTFGLLSAQLLLTVAIAASIISSQPLKTYTFQNPWLLWTSLVLSFACVIVMSCSETLRRQHPWNLVFMFVFTMCEGLLVGVITATYDTHVVVIAGGITAVVVVGLCLFAMQTKVDFTLMSGMMFTVLLTFIMMGFMMSLAATFTNLNMSIVDVVYSSMGALIFSCYLVVDIQLVMGGKKQYSISPDEYVFAALNLYLDIINLFLYILRLVAEKK